jgi:hypothetical protein
MKTKHKTFSNRYKNTTFAFAFLRPPDFNHPGYNVAPKRDTSNEVQP